MFLIGAALACGTLAYFSAIGDDPVAKPGPTAGLSDDVRTVLDPAIEEQAGHAFAADLKDFEVRLLITSRDPDKGTLNFDVTRLWKSPNLVFTHVEETVSQKVFDEGFDGETYWLSNKQGVTLFVGPDHKVDRKKIRDDVDIMMLMMQCFFLEKALPKLQDLKRLDDVELELPSPDSADETVKAKCQALRGRMIDLPEGIGEISSVTLHVAADSHQLVRIRLEPDEKDRSPTELRFSDHIRNSQGVLVPSRVEVWRGNGKEPWQEISLEGAAGKDGETLNNMRFNVGLETARFAAPDQAKVKAKANDGKPGPTKGDGPSDAEKKPDGKDESKR